MKAEIEAKAKMETKTKAIINAKVETQTEVEAKTEAYWKAEALKVNATSSVQVDVGCVPNTGRDVVDTILGNCHDYDVVVMGSLELVIAKGKIALGSVAHSVAKRCKAHVCIVKNFSCI